MNRLLLIFTLLTPLVSTPILASLGTLVDNGQIPNSVCAAEFTVGDEKYHCSGALVDQRTFKTAAHCLKEGADIRVHCASGERRKVVKVLGHNEFSLRSIKRDLYARKFDQALLRLDSKLIKARVRKTLTQASNITKFLSSKRECAFFGVGLNPWYSGTGLLHGVKTNSTEITVEEGLLIINDRFNAVSMIGDSGASFFCRGDSGDWVNVGTVSAHGWDNETIVSSNANLESDKNLLFDTSVKEIKQDSEEFLEFDSVITAGQRYRVNPFSPFFSMGEEYNIADRLRSRFEVIDVEGDYATGTLAHYGPALYYLCGDGVICDEEVEKVRIHIKYLVKDYIKPVFLDLK